MIWLLISVNLVFLLLALFFIRRYFRRVSGEINSLVEEFNRNAERNLILLEDRLRRIDNPDDRTLYQVRLLHKEGLSEEEIAEKLSLPLSQVSFIIDFSDKL